MSISLKRKLYILVILSLFLQGCFSGLTALASAPRTRTPETTLVGFSPDSATTNTPFQPLPITPTSDHPIFPTATTTATPKAGTGQTGGYLSPAIPPPVPLIDQPDNQINILLMGSDARAYTGGFRTDTLILVTVNFDTNKVSLTSFPRDLWVYIPGWQMQRINAAQPHGGFALTQDTFEYNFGVRPDHYALITFNGFQSLIDTLGGIDVQVAQALTDERTGYGVYTVNPGTVHMNGEFALWYVRSRYTTSDFDRARRQQEVIQALFNRMLNFDLVTKVPQLYEQFKGIIQSDMPIDEILKLVPVAAQVAQGNNIRRFTISSSHITPWVTSGGAQVLLPNKDAIRALLMDALNSP